MDNHVHLLVGSKDILERHVVKALLSRDLDKEEANIFLTERPTAVVNRL